MYHHLKYKATFHLDADGSLVQREHWDDKEVTAIHQVKGDQWTAVSNCLLHFNPNYSTRYKVMSIISI